MDGISKQTIEHWKKLWETWDIRVFILFSLFLRILLIFSAPSRKRMSKAYITMPMWLAYLLADITANFAIGLISKSQWSNSDPVTNPDLLAFWAPFLLVHLGGPDTITAFALEDNELWLRHALGLGFQCWAVAYAFFQSFPNRKLRIPTVLVFIAGLIKYTERTRSLYLASSRRFRESLFTEPDPGPNYAKLMDTYISKIKARLPTRIEMLPEPNRVIKIESEGAKDNLSDLEVVRRAYGFFETFKGLIVDLIFSFRERTLSRDFFLNRTARDAFKVVEVELNFIYEILYTKVMVVQSRFGCFLRLVSVLLNCAALVLFYFTGKQGFHKFDIEITYTLLLGAIALDAIAFLMVLSSDWTAVTLTKSDYPSFVTKFFGNILKVNRVRWPENSWRIMQIVRRRWSESISQFNLIHYCLNPRSKWWQKTIEFFGLTNMLDGLKYVKTVDFPNDLRFFIFEELKMKSDIADDLETAKEIYSARGDWVLRFESCTNLLPWINEVDFDDSLLLWHIATELCLNAENSGNATNTEVNNANNSGIAANTEGVNAKNSGNTPNTEGDSAKNSGNADEKDYCKLSKHLSDYMLYLLIMQSTMMSTVAGIGQIRFRDTCAEAKKFFRGRKIRKTKEKNCCLNVFPVDKCLCCSKLEHNQQNQTSPIASAAQAQLGEETTHSCSNILCFFTKCCCKGDAGLDKVQIKACNSILGVNTAVKPVADKCFCCSKLELEQRIQASRNASAAQEKQGEEMTHSCSNILCCFTKSCCKRDAGEETTHSCSNILCCLSKSCCKREAGEKQGEETTRSCSNILCCFTKCCCKGDTGPDKVQIKACNSILGVNTAVKPVAVKGDRSKSVLFDASMLAKELNKLGEKRKWEIMSKVWVELLSYAACHCRAITHAAQLSKGGQLITLVWLLMAHLGLGSQFQISEGHARAKLIVGK